jgi:hypothetical protein
MLLVRGSRAWVLARRGSINNSSPSLADIVGVWDGSVTNINGTDEIYTVIKANGAAISYDYLGDSFDRGPNCYDKDTYTITDLGGGNFSGDGLVWNAIISNGNLVATGSFEGNAFTITDVPSSLLESDFAPICNF